VHNVSPFTGRLENSEVPFYRINDPFYLCMWIGRYRIFNQHKYLGELAITDKIYISLTN